MTGHWERLNAWHLQLSILADAFDHVLREVEDPPGVSATADVLNKRLAALVDVCPFPDRLAPAALDGGSLDD